MIAAMSDAHGILLDSMKKGGTHVWLWGYQRVANKAELRTLLRAVKGECEWVREKEFYVEVTDRIYHDVRLVDNVADN
jgi:hypothetical protein